MAADRRRVARRSALLAAAAAVMVVRLIVATSVIRDGASTSPDFERFWYIAGTSAQPYVAYQVEYTPLTVAVVKALATITRSRPAFGRTLAALAVAADVGICVGLIATFNWEAAAIYLLVSLPLIHLFYNRFDLLPALAAVAGIAALRRGRPVTAAAALATGVALKLWPLPLVPLLVRAANPRQRRVIAIALGLFGAATAGGTYLAAGNRGLLQVATMRGATGWQIESTVGNAISMVAGHRTLQFGSGAFRIGHMTSADAVVSLIVATGLAFAFALVGAGRRQVGATWLASIGALLVLSPLLSPQFMAWIAPAVAIAWVEGDHEAAALGAWALALTGAYWPHYMEMMNGSRWEYAIMARNIALCGMVVAAAAALRRRAPASPTAMDPIGASDAGRALSSAAKTGRVEGMLGLMMLSAVLTLGQIGLFMSVAPGRSLTERYLSAFQGDSVWYADIALRGYVTTMPPVPIGEQSNVTHFPAYPAAIWTVRHALSLTYRGSALVAAQLCAWGFWTYVLLLFRRWKVPREWQAGAILAIGAHPTAFFLVTAYSEPMFLMTAFGYWFWYLNDRRGSFVLAAGHGLVLTATRITGASCVVAALVQSAARRAVCRTQASARLVPAAALVTISLAGVGSFFAYCELTFGAWNLYQIRQTLGWGHRPDYLAPFYPSAYRLFIPDWQDVSAFGAFENPYVIASILIYAGLCVRRRVALEGAGLVAMAAAVFYVSVCGVYHTRFAMMGRYQFPVHAMLVVAFTQAFGSGARWPSWARLAGAAALVGLACAGMMLQLSFTAMFARAGPVK